MRKHARRVDTHYQGPECSDGWPDFVPTSAILVTCIGLDGKPNIIPLTGWGVLCRFPFVFGIAICQGQYTKNYFPRFSHHLLEEVPEFVVNIPHSGLRDAITVCGSMTGGQGDKFQAAGLTPQPSLIVRPPVIAECPVNFECRVVNRVSLGSHDVFLGEAVAVHSAEMDQCVDEDLMTMTLDLDAGRTGKLSWRSLPHLQIADAPGECDSDQPSTFVRA